ncbi:hypothetical protein NS230_06695 [Methylobacterium indicum]|uniref:hypothetical protein n=1 Tax=Methylobacterium indicum TaxID=1775910 RepID=UPI000733FB4C|nr:hypothetical protein NS230_06695 [Methylobacterium indicum]
MLHYPLRRPRQIGISDSHKLNAGAPQGEEGLCRFNPPVSQPEPQGHGLWPVVSSQDWCGHFSPEMMAGE